MSAILRPKDAAQYLGISVGTLYRWAQEQPGFPQPIKIGPRTTGWRQADLDAWLDRQQEGGTAA